MALFTVSNPEYKRLTGLFSEMTFARNLGKNGIYQAAVLEFLSWLEQYGIHKLDSVTGEHLFLYAEYLDIRPNFRLGGTLSASSKAGHLLALKTFFDYLLDIKALNAAVVIPTRSRATSQPRDILTVEEVKDLYVVCENRRDRAILSCAYGAGLRRTEIHWLDVSDVHLTRARLTVREGKGRKTRSVVLCEAVIQDFKAYLYEERQGYLLIANKHTNAFLVNSRGRRMKGDHMNTRVKELVDKLPELASRNISLHSLRASISTHLIDRGADMTFVQNFLGHSCIDSSHLYMRRRKQKLLLQAEVSKLS